MQFITARRLVVTATIIIAGCDGPPVAPPTVATVEIDPPSGVVEVGHRLQLRATARDLSERVVSGRAVWTSSDPTLAMVSPDGLVAGIRPGSVTIAASSDGTRASAEVTVIGRLATLEIEAPATFVDVGSTLGLRAVAADALGRPLPEPPVEWSSSDATVATISERGVVSGVRAGGVTITAAVDGQSASMPLAIHGPATTIEVGPRPEFHQLVGRPFVLHATVKDAAGHILPNRPVTWRVFIYVNEVRTESGPTIEVVPSELGGMSIMAFSENLFSIVDVVVTGPLTCETLWDGRVWDNLGGIFLGELRNPSRWYSILSTTGRFAPTNLSSIFNPAGPYGSPTATMSAYNPNTTRPPRISMNGWVLANVSKNTSLPRVVDPDVLRACEFP